MVCININTTTKMTAFTFVQFIPIYSTAATITVSVAIEQNLQRSNFLLYLNN